MSPPGVELTTVPFFPQKRYQCGPAALATVLNYYGHRTTPQQLRPRMYLPARGGSLAMELTAAGRAFGMVAYPLAPRWEDLLEELRAGHPVIVLQNLRLSWWPQWHYAVVIGYDSRAGSVILRSGRERRRRTSLHRFLRTWGRSGYWARVFVPPGELPASAEPVAYLQAVSDLEQTGRLEAAYAAYKAAIAYWPDNVIAWIGAGNTALRRQQPEISEYHFRHATRAAPRNVAAWNNLAYSLLARGCTAGAKDAVQCAVRLAPRDERIRQSWREIRLVTMRAAEHCAPVVCPE